MQSSFKKTQCSEGKTTNIDNLEKFSEKDESIYLPSFTGFSSNQTFQQHINGKGLTQRSSTSLSHTHSVTEDLNMINDSTQYIFNLTSNKQVQNDDIFDSFQDLANELDFQMIQRQANYSTAIKKTKTNSLMSKANILEWFSGCFPNFNKKQGSYLVNGSGTSNAPTAIKIVISNTRYDDRQQRICRIKALSGPLREAQIFIEKFKQRSSHYVPHNFGQQNPNFFFYDIQKQIDHETKKSIQHSDPYHLEISTYYVIEKILSNQIYQIGIIVHKLLQDYQNMFKNIQQSVSLLPEPLNNAIKIVNQIFYWFKDSNNEKTDQLSQSKANKTSFDKKQNSLQKNKKIKKINLHVSMTPFIRISIQKLIFKKLSSPLIEIYRLKSFENQNIFINKREKIFQKFSTKQILEQISLNQKFWAVDSAKSNDLEHIHSRSETRYMLKMSPFCCSELEKIVLTYNPRQKIKHMELAYTSLKTFYYDYSNKKFELSSMEDIIPVLILIILLINIPNLRQELDLIGDFIEYDPYQMESQKRLFINISIQESYNYVLRDWKI